MAGPFLSQDLPAQVVIFPDRPADDTRRRSEWPRDGVVVRKSDIRHRHVRSRRDTWTAADTVDTAGCAGAKTAYSAYSKWQTVR